MENQKEEITLDQYIQKWRAEDLKPKNEDVFIDLFIKFLYTIDDCRDLEFEGEGSYYGKQISLIKDRVYVYNPALNFEICYSSDLISIYTGNHNGFWNPEYVKIDNTHPRFKELKSELYHVIYRLIGLDDLTTKES